MALMRHNFGVEEGRVRDILQQVHRDQTLWMTAVGLLLLIAPARRFGNSYIFIIAMPRGDDLFGFAYLAVGIVMFYALRTENRKLMSHSLFAAGMLNWSLGTFLLIGAIAGPTGVLGAPFALYVGRHMFVQSVLLSQKWKRT